MSLYELVAPLAGREPRLLFEEPIDLRVRREAALSRDGIVAVLGEVLHHAHGLIETDVAEPCAEVGVRRQIEIFRQFALLAVDISGQCINGGVAVLIVPFLAPFGECVFYLLSSTLR